MNTHVTINNQRSLFLAGSFVIFGLFIALPLPSATADDDQTTGQPQIFTESEINRGNTSGVIAPEDLNIRMNWHQATTGRILGRAGIEIADIDADGKTEIVVTAQGASDDSNNTFWYVYENDGIETRRRYISLPPYTRTVDRLIAVQIDEDPALEILVATTGALLVYDGSSFELESEFTTASGEINGLAAANLDGDPAIEAVICDDDDAWIFDLSTGLEQLSLGGMGCFDATVAETDGTPGLEIVISNGNIGRVLDGATGAVEWNHPLGFGWVMTVADFDGDGLSEIAAGHKFGDIQVWNGDTKSLLWDHTPAHDLWTLSAGDVDHNGNIELLYSEDQFRNVEILNGNNGANMGTIINPGNRIYRITVASVDGDDRNEIVFGSERELLPNMTASLIIKDSDSPALEILSSNMTGPYLGFAHGDIDADGEPEFIYTSFQSTIDRGDGLFFIHDARSKKLEYQSPEPTGSNWQGLWDIDAANVDADPQMEIFLPTGVTHSGELRCIDGISKTIQWSQELESGQSFVSVRAADIDNDGNMELIASTATTAIPNPGPFVHQFDALTGALEWQSPDLAGYFSGYSPLTMLRIADVDDDDVNEILVAAPESGLLILDSVAQSVDLDGSGIEVTALETADLDGDEIPEILVGNADGEIETLDPDTGILTLIAGPFAGKIQGLAVEQILGDESLDYVFIASDQLHIVDGATGVVYWASDTLGEEVGKWDSLRVGDFDADGEKEIWVNGGEIGHFIFELSDIILKGGFETNNQL